MDNWAESFESIGDNCELGFMQKQKGVDQGALLKWCRIMSHLDLIKILTLPREQFYIKDNLAPIYDDMLVDKSSNIQFHTSLFSEEGDGVRKFVALDLKFDTIYQLEYEKKIYMYDKFFSNLRSAGKIYVYKMNECNDISIAEEILRCLKIYNPNNNLLYVTDLDKERAGSVEMLKPNLYRGFIKSFAPYYPVTEARLDFWEPMCQNAIRSIAI
jgi:hypothetical protein